MSPQTRRYPGRIQSRLMFILVDGKSEKRYFEDFVKTNPRLRIVIWPSRDQCSYPKALKYCLSQASNHSVKPIEGDRTVIVTDVDLHSDGDVRTFDENCEKAGVELFVSNPSFEVWLLLHYREITRWMSCEELNDELTRVLGRKYVKSEGIPYDKDRLDNALRNGFRQFDDYRRRNELCLGKDRCRTSLHLLVKEIQEF